MLSRGCGEVNGRDSSDAETESECHSVTGGGGGDADEAGQESDGHSATGGGGGNTHHREDALFGGDATDTATEAEAAATAEAEAAQPKAA